MTFKEQVIQIVSGIKPGTTMTYKQVAQKAGNSKAARAVGMIMNKHTIPGLPCHRVVSSNGTYGGYRWGNEKKIALLNQEGVTLKNS